MYDSLLGVQKSVTGQISDPGRINAKRLVRHDSHGKRRVCEVVNGVVLLVNVHFRVRLNPVRTHGAYTPDVTMIANSGERACLA